MKVQLWEADFVPSLIPDFISNHITVDYDFMKSRDVYLFSLDHNHKVFSKCKNEVSKKKLARTLMLKLGFVNLSYITTSEMPDEWWDCPCHSDHN